MYFVAWEEDGEEHGMVEVKTTNAPLRLVVLALNVVIVADRRHLQCAMPCICI